MAEHTLSCITSLLESVPRWVADIEDILESSRKRQNDILAEQQPVDPPPRSVRRKLSKSSSLRSKRSRDAADQDHAYEPNICQPDTETSQLNLLRPQLPHMTESDALRLSQRKRKTFSVCSGDPSAPHKYRSKAMVVVYYDGDTQKRFEMLVRSIATSRHAVRKCGTVSKFESFLRTESETTDLSSDGVECDEGCEEEPPDRTGLDFKSTRAMRTPNKSCRQDDGVEDLSKVDECLDKGQDLCERAAHQILRDGD
jgi:hypothetical protein